MTGYLQPILKRCDSVHVTAQVWCQKPEGHDGAHVHETSTGIYGWGPSLSSEPDLDAGCAPASVAT